MGKRWLQVWKAVNPLGISSLKEENCRLIDHCWKEHKKWFRYMRNANFYEAIASL